MSTNISKELITSINFRENLTRLNKGTLGRRGPLPGSVSAVNAGAIEVAVKDSAAAAKARDSAVISLAARDKAAHEELMKDLAAKPAVE